MTTRKTIVDGNRRATNELVGLSIEESSGVTQGDNPEAHVVLMKQKEAQRQADTGPFSRMISAVKSKLGVGPTDTNKDYSQPRTMNQILVADRAQEEMWKLRMAFCQSMYSILENSQSSEQMGSLLVQSAAEFAGAVKDVAASLSGDAQKALSSLIEQLQDSAKAMQQGDVQKRTVFADALGRLKDFDNLDVNPEHKGAPEISKPDEGKENTMTVNKDKKDPPSSLEEALKGVDDGTSKFIKEHVQRLIDAAGAKAAEEAKKAQASGNDQVMAQLVVMQKTQDEMRTHMKKTEEELALLKDEKQGNAFITKARKLGVPGMPITEVAEMLQLAFSKSKETGEKLERHYASLSAQVDFTETMGRQIGTRNGADTEEETGFGKLQKIARELQAKNPGMHYAVAWRKAADAHPELKNEAIFDNDEALMNAGSPSDASDDA